MKSRTFDFAFAVLVVVTLAVSSLLVMQGCTAAQLANADRALGGTPPQPTTAPTTQPGVYTTINPTNGQLTIHLVQDAANLGAAASAYAPAPWGPIAATGFGILSAVLTAVAVKQTNAAAIANSVIAAAAPGTAAIVKQITDNQTLASDVTTIAQVAPGVISMFAHPAAQAALAATGTASKAA